MRPGFTGYAVSAEIQHALSERVEAAIETAGPDFGVAIHDLIQSVSDANAIQVMAVMSMYLGTAPAGTNPERDRPLGMYQHHLELAQAALLRNGAAAGNLPAGRYVPGISDAVLRYNDAWLTLQLQKVRVATEGEARDRERLLCRLRIQASTRRGWGYEGRMIPMLSELLEPLDEIARERVGIAASSLVKWWVAMGERINARLEEHRRAVSRALDWPQDDSWLGRLDTRFGKVSGTHDKNWKPLPGDDASRRQYVQDRADLCVHRIYAFTLDEATHLLPDDVGADVVKSILEGWSMIPGDDGGVGMQHLPLENPVLPRPFVQSAEPAWYLFCPWVLLHNPFELLESVIGRDPELRASYLDRRATFLEERVGALLEAAFPGARIERSLFSRDPSDGREYENDAIALVSTFAVVVEAKAGRLHPDARRGRPRVLRDRMDELLVKPTEQGRRLAGRLEQETGIVRLRRKKPDAEVSINASEIRKTLVVSVTLEPIADLLPRLADVAGSGLTRPVAGALAYSISLPDLELIVDLLEHPSEVLHYLHRRTEIEHSAFLTGDEVDLLGLYLQSGFNLGEHEFSGQHLLDVTGVSDPIDVWHYAREAGLPDVQRPTSARSAWWAAVLTRVEKRGGPRWAEIGVTLCNVAPEDQRHFESAMHELRRSIRAGERPANEFVVLHNGPVQRRDVLVGVIVTSPERAERERQYDAAAAAVMAKHNVSRVIVLAWTPRPLDIPYFGLMLFANA